MVKPSFGREDGPGAACSGQIQLQETGTQQELTKKASPLAIQWAR